MGDAHRRIGGVDRLAAGPGRAVDVDPQILVVDLNVDLFGLGQHRDGRCRGVDAPARFGHRPALEAVDARFELELDRKSVVWGTSVSVRVDRGVRRTLQRQSKLLTTYKHL